MTTVFHLNNRDAHRQLTVSGNGVPLPNINNPVSLGVTLEHSLTYKNHMRTCAGGATPGTDSSMPGRLQLGGGGGGTHQLCEQVTHPHLQCYRVAEYASPVWSSCAHTYKLDSVLIDTLQFFTGCMRPTETMFLPLLASHGITPPDIRCDA